MSAAANDLAIYKGEHAVLPFQQLQADHVTPEDITGRTYVLTVRKHPTDSTALLTVTASIDVPGSGEYSFDLPKAVTVLLAARVYAYDIQRTDAGSEQPVSIGTFTVLQEVLYP